VRVEKLVYFQTKSRDAQLPIRPLTFRIGSSEEPLHKGFQSLPIPKVAHLAAVHVLDLTPPVCLPTTQVFQPHAQHEQVRALGRLVCFVFDDHGDKASLRTWDIEHVIYKDGQRRLFYTEITRQLIHGDR